MPAASASGGEVVQLEKWVLSMKKEDVSVMSWIEIIPTSDDVLISVKSEPLSIRNVSICEASMSGNEPNERAEMETVESVRGPSVRLMNGDVSGDRSDVPVMLT